MSFSMVERGTFQIARTILATKQVIPITKFPGNIQIGKIETSVQIKEEPKINHHLIKFGNHEMIVNSNYRMY